MRKISARQVHLDFHTSQWIPNVGEAFDKKQFQEALREGNVGSITIFAKCHHGYCYYPTHIGTQHPTLRKGRDLTAEMMEAAHEIGVDAPVYITAGWSALDEQTHPEWIMRNKDGSESVTNVDENASADSARPLISWKNLCLNGEYADHVYALTQEIVDRYERLDGLFFDICSLEKACYCEHCRNAMLQQGLNPENDEQANIFHVRQHQKFMERCKEILLSKFPEATIFFNGCAEMYAPEYHESHTHFEMEDLPTTSGGYNKMPIRASYMRHYGKEIVGMTGKFHTVWGEFGGYKNPIALKQEIMAMAMYGAKCNIGDQMPPSGRMDMETYRSIGVAFRALEKIEPYVYPAQSTAQIGVYLAQDEAADQGLNTMLLESQVDFEMVKPDDELSPYKLLILPDCVKVPAEEAHRIRSFVDQGGAVIFGYRSLLADGKLLLDVGVSAVKEPTCRQDYLNPSAIKLDFGNAPFLCYQAGMRITTEDCQILSDIYEPYFDRTYGRYCSHMNTPPKENPSGNAAVVQKGKVIYYAHPLCSMYHRNGAQLFKMMIQAIIGRVYHPRYRTKMPSAGRTRLTWQEAEKRYIFHAAYASPIQRGNVAVLEDIVPLYEVPVDIDLTEKVSDVRLVPQNIPVDYVQEDGILRFSIPKIEGYQAVSISIDTII